MEGRFDPFYYIPELLKLEEQVKNQTSYRLGDFINSMAGGATPSVQEEEKYYSNSEDGVPFIRVQNLSPTNQLILNDLKFINQETHQSYLKRSQVSESDLLVKITGVGRMAVASVPPLGFEGNINQHIVVIKTDNRETSEIIASFLNSDIGEKLASRRAVGGTRPALDYGGLKSIPIVFKSEILEVFRETVAAIREKDRAAAALLSSTDDYLLSTLGIELPPPGKGDLQERVFFRQMSEVTGGRMDPEYFHPERTKATQAVMGGKYPAQRLYHISDNKRIITTENLHQLPYIGLENVESGSGTLVKSDEKSDFGTALYFEEGWVLYAKLRPYLNKVWYATFRGYCSTEFVVLNSQVVDNQFLAAFLQSKVIVQQTRHMMSGNTLPRLQPEDIDSLMIPVPPRDVQDEIIRVTDQKRQQALSLQSEGRQLLAEARRQVEQIILGH